MATVTDEEMVISRMAGVTRGAVLRNPSGCRGTGTMSLIRVVEMPLRRKHRQTAAFESTGQ
jgi:hypothetical protein